MFHDQIKKIAASWRKESGEGAETLYTDLRRSSRLAQKQDKLLQETHEARHQIAKTVQKTPSVANISAFPEVKVVIMQQAPGDMNFTRKVKKSKIVKSSTRRHGKSKERRARKQIRAGVLLKVADNLEPRGLHRLQAIRDIKRPARGDVIPPSPNKPSDKHTETACTTLSTIVHPGLN